jgi:hypothetical protein
MQLKDFGNGNGNKLKILGLLLCFLQCMMLDLYSDCLRPQRNIGNPNTGNLSPSNHLPTAWVLVLIAAVRSSPMSTSAIGVELA